MSDILLKGVSIDIPENGIDCEFNPHGRCLFCKNICATINGRPDFCPMILIPPHGDLIDKEVVLRERLSPGSWDYDLVDLDGYLADIPIVIWSNKEF